MHLPADPDRPAPSAVETGAAADGYDRVAEQDEARRARARRDHALTASERLEHLHRLCADLARMTPTRPPEQRQMLADLAGLIRVLADYRVRCVVIGGVAVAAHGYVRATEDIDVVPDPDPDNLDRLGNALVFLDARLTADSDGQSGPTERQALSRGRNLTATTRLGDIDVVQRLPGVPGFAALAAEAEHTTLGGVALDVASRAHLIAMKEARGSAQDRADLERLRPPAAG